MSEIRHKVLIDISDEDYEKVKNLRDNETLCDFWASIRIAEAIKKGKIKKSYVDDTKDKIINITVSAATAPEHIYTPVNDFKVGICVI